MGKLHKIRKAFEQLPETTKKEMTRFGGNHCVSFDPSGRAVITKEQPRGSNHRSHFPYLRSLLVRYGYKKPRPRPYTRMQQIRVTFTGGWLGEQKIVPKKKPAA